VAPVAAVGAVGAVVAGTLVLVDGPRRTPVPAGEASTSPTRGTTPQSTKHSASPVSPQPVIVLPFPTSADLGPVPAAEANAAAQKDCRLPDARSKAIQVLWARQVHGISTASKVLTLLVKGPAQPGGTYDQGIALCQPGLGIFPVSDAQWAKTPGREGVIAIGGSGFSTGPTKMTFQLWTVYRARPEIVRIESRYVWKGGSGPWIKGVVADGFAYTDSRATPVGTIQGMRQELRAYDANGRLVPITT
jgi:hypothetical protein